MDEKKCDPGKRTMTPAIADMSVKEERMCLSEIRTLAPNIHHEYTLRNGMTAGAFSLKYVMGHHIKRKSKCSTNNKGNTGR